MVVAVLASADGDRDVASERGTIVVVGYYKLRSTTTVQLLPY